MVKHCGCCSRWRQCGFALATCPRSTVSPSTSNTERGRCVANGPASVEEIRMAKGLARMKASASPSWRKRKCSGIYTDPILLLSCPSRRLLLTRDWNFLDVGDQNSLSSLCFHHPSLPSFIFHFLGKDALKFRQVLSLSRKSSIWLLSHEIPRP